MTRKSDSLRLIQALRERGLSSRSASLYADEVARVERWCVEHGWTAKNVPGAVLETYVNTRPFTWSTRKLTSVALSHYWSIVGRRRPPSWAVRVPKKPEMVCRALEPEIAQQLARAARSRSDRMGLAVLLALYVGMRREEIARLRWDDLTGDGWVRMIGKGDKPAELPLHPAVLHALSRFERHPNSPWVFPGRRLVRPVHPTTVWTWTRKVALDAGVGEIAPHVLRHTCLATSNDNTGDLRAVQAFARHAKPETTAGYTRATRARLLKAVNALDY